MEHVQSEARVDHEIIIVGAGFSGLGLGIELKKRYLHDFVILERAGDLGGTWRDNTYPGLTVDIPSASYSYPFEPNPDWTHATQVYPTCRIKSRAITMRWICEVPS